MEVEIHHHSRSIVISLGGSTIVPDDIDTGFLIEFRRLLEEKIKAGFRFVIVVGGGKLARKYQHALKKVTEPTLSDLDWIGIYATHINANLLRFVFGEYACHEIVTDPNEIPNTEKPIIVAGGWKPGWSTDYVSVLIANELGAKQVINLTNINYVYTKDPREYPDAKPITQINWREFRKLLPEEWDPGLSTPFDPVAAKLAESFSLEVSIMRGNNIENLRQYLEGQDFLGTVIS